MPDNTEPVAKNIDTNLTNRLVNSLLWYGEWDSLEPEALVRLTNRERHLRRSAFPTWTWAGWKTCSIRGGRIRFREIFDNCTTVDVEYEDEEGLIKRLDWERDNERIQNLSHQESRIPLCLVINGTVMDIKLAWEEGTNEYEQGGNFWGAYRGGWTFTSPPFLAGKWFLAPPMSV